MLSKISAEFIGTFWLVLGGCGSAVLAAAFPDVGIGLLGVSLAFGLTVVTGAYALGPVSGGHTSKALFDVEEPPVTERTKQARDYRRDGLWLEDHYALLLAAKY